MKVIRRNKFEKLCKKLKRLNLYIYKYNYLDL